MKVFILLPAYNEEESLGPLIAQIEETMGQRGIDYEIIICDDGSTDDSAAVIRSLTDRVPMRTISHKINRGLGETVRDLFELAAELATSEDVIVRLDCDDTHDPALILSMLDKLRGGADVVIASRFQPGGGQVGIGRWRGFVSYCANLFMKLFFPIAGIREYSCGFRAYRASVIQDAIGHYGNNFIQLRGLGFTCTLEKIVKLRLRRCKFAEVPFVLRYDKKRSGSKMAFSITTFGYIVMVVLCYWPWGGWLNSRSKLPMGRERVSPDTPV